jgi:hypothetical protein
MKTPEGEKSCVFLAFAGFGASLVGLIVTPILVNVMGGLAFYNDPSYGVAQGLGSLFFFLGILPLAPLGALYWGIVTPLSLTRVPRGARRIILPAAIYILLVLAVVLAIGWSYPR